jgi:Ca-activated chloride channel family protein
MSWWRDLSWAEPWYALVALAAAPAVWLGLRAAGRVTYSSLGLLPAGAATWRTRLAWLPAGLVGAAIVALAIAMAGPRHPENDARIRREGIAIAMVMDTSSSMQALDLSEPDRELTRLDAVKRVFEQFVLGSGGSGGLRGRPDDTIGLIGFARYADTRSPLTLDHANLVTAARALQLTPPRSPEDGTAIGDGLALAVERLAASPARSKVAIVLTDGEDNASAVTPEEAAVFAREQGIKVYTIGAGTNGTAPIRVADGMGGSRLVAMPVSIDEALLRGIAETTGGRYFRATDADGLRAVYDEIDRLERTTQEETRFYDHDEHYDLVLAIGLGLAALGLLLGATWLRRLP